MPSATRLRRPKPRATKTGNSSLSTRRVRLRACPTTAAPARATSAASNHQPTACRWMEPATSAAGVLTLAKAPMPSDLT